MRFAIEKSLYDGKYFCFGISKYMFLILNKNISMNSHKPIDFLDKFLYITILETL